MSKIRILKTTHGAIDLKNLIAIVKNMPTEKNNYQQTEITLHYKHRSQIKLEYLLESVADVEFEIILNKWEEYQNGKS